MTNKEMFTEIITRLDSMETGLNGRMDSLESGLIGLNGRIDSLETRINELESDIDMEFQAVRMEMNVANKSLQKDISVLNDKIDRLMYTNDVDGRF